MQFKKIAFLTFFITIFFAACGTDNSKNDKNTNIEEIKNFKLTTTEAQTLNITRIENGFVFEEYKGKAVLVNFFATWCQPCIVEIPYLVHLKEKYKNDFEIVSVLLEDNKRNDKVKDFISEYNINYVVTNSRQNLTFSDIVGGVEAIPTMFLYNKEGEIIQKYVGIVPIEMMEIDIKKAIK
ncbi:TlpA disulfide reductase family protein [uncultured Arcobacter sp.]|uniref:TlpA family protein disulfide reductase n=1 Tax=uncultured Arcobacter sp. TaxID=165434 RepID=UPI0026161540|nr:TlpA disulfide reductase family protein [uncultured Arcobacter sp.]